MTEIENKELINELARDLVMQIAPQELPLFRAHSEAYFKDQKKALQNQSAKDEILGFGPGGAVVLLTPIALTVVDDVIAFMVEEVKKAAQAESASWINDTVKAMFKKFRPEEKEEKGKPVPLTPEQLAQVRHIVVKKARQLKLSDERARTLADTVVGGLATP